MIYDADGNLTVDFQDVPITAKKPVPWYIIAILLLGGLILSSSSR